MADEWQRDSAYSQVRGEYHVAKARVGDAWRYSAWFGGQLLGVCRTAEEAQALAAAHEEAAPAERNAG